MYQCLTADHDVLNVLEQTQIGELLDWDAERYRMKQAKRP